MTLTFSRLPREQKTTMLPPCRVCNEKGTGLHYGVNTCEACKAFFVRCLHRKRDKRCKRSNNCSLKSTRKHTCAACRYAKCIALGMSKDAIKTGRCSNERKTRDIEEVKKLEIQARIKEDGSLVTQEERNERLEIVITRLTEIHHEHIPHSASVIAELRVLEDKFVRDRAARQQGLDVPMCPYRDKDGKLSYDHTDVLKILIERSVKSFITFVKIVPGFNSMPPNDQVKLIKASYLSCWAFLFSNWYNTDQNVFVFPYEPSIILSLDDVTCLTNAPHLREFMIKIVHRVQALGLTTEESILVEALCFLLAEAELSEEATKLISASVDYLIEALQYLLNQHHDTSEHTLSKIMLIMTDLKQFDKI